MLEALAALHGAGIVMRALRPEYILISVRYTGPRKQNFVAQTKIVGGAFWNLVPAANLTEDEFTRGEAQYIAPELKSFEPVASPRSDVYSAGVIFYEMLVGGAPVGSYQLPKVKRPDLPDHVNTVAELALAQSPDDRYPSCSDFMTDLQRAFQEAYTQPTAARSRIPPIGWALALAFVLFVGIIIFALFPGNSERSAEIADAEDRAAVYEALKQSQPSSGDFKQIYARHPPNMIYIPPGPFIAGRMRLDPNAGSSEPLAEQRQTDGYLIDVFEFPNLPNKPPRFGVTQTEAKALCEKAGKRLCTADEWERACKGPESEIYAYGDAYDTEFCGEGLSEAYPSGSKEKCTNEWRVYDQSGNFREWTATETKPSRIVVKGGLKGQPEKGTRCAHEGIEGAEYTDNSLSFRCCRDADAPPVKK